jgi:hypothetical protein
MARKPVVVGEPAEDNRPRNPRAYAPPTEGFVVEVDGKLKAEYPAIEAALVAGREIKKNFPSVQVKIYDAKERTRTPVDVPKAEETEQTPSS